MTTALWTSLRTSGFILIRIVAAEEKRARDGAQVKAAPATGTTWIRMLPDTRRLSMTSMAMQASHTRSAGSIRRIRPVHSCRSLFLPARSLPAQSVRVRSHGLHRSRRDVSRAGIESAFREGRRRRGSLRPAGRLRLDLPARRRVADVVSSCALVAGGLTSSGGELFYWRGYGICYERATTTVNIPDGLRRVYPASPEADKVVIVIPVKRALQKEVSAFGLADAKELIEGVYAGKMRGACVPAAGKRDGVLEVVDDTEEFAH
jgi:hypothetical protein